MLTYFFVEGKCQLLRVKICGGKETLPLIFIDVESPLVV